jgi:plasmid stabilization system protein ParE
METPKQKTFRGIVQLSEAAHFDLAGIDNSTADIWGEAQAERYIAYLRETFAQLLHDPALGKTADNSSGIRIYIAKFRKRRNAHGHRILYRPIDGGIRIIRILHTAMHWPDHLGD